MGNGLKIGIVIGVIVGFIFLGFIGFNMLRANESENVSNVNPNSDSLISKTMSLYPQQTSSPYKILMVTGNESIYYNVQLNGKEVCLIPKFSGTKEVIEEVDDALSVEGATKQQTTIYSIPDSVKVASFDSALKPSATSLTKNKDGNFCYTIPDGTQWLKLGEESVVLVGDSLYNSIDTNVTQETGFAHLNITTASPYDSLIAYYPFDASNDVSTTAYDYSNNNLDGTTNIAGGSPSWIPDAVYGGGYNFTGISGNYINFGNSQLFNMSAKNFTVNMWIKPLQKSGSSYILNKLTTTAGVKDYGIYMDATNSVYFGVGTGTSTVIACSKKTPYNVWQMVTLVFNGTRVAGYINGTQVCQATFTGTRGTGGGSLRLGERSGTSGSAYNGSVDEIMIFDRALTNAEIQSILQNTSVRFANFGTQLFNDTNVSTTGLENKLNISIANVQTPDNTNISVSLNGGAYYNLTNGTINNLAFTGNPMFLNLSLRYYSATGFYTPIAQGNITLTSWFDTTTGDTEYPQFTNFFDNNGTLVGNGIAKFNSTIIRTNGTVFLSINNQNYTAQNISDGIYNASVNISAGNYIYYWGAFGNGSSTRYNISQTRHYSVNLTGGGDTTPPYFLVIPPSTSVEYGTKVYALFEATDNIALKNYYVNSSKFSINSTGGFINATALIPGVYYTNVSINDTSNNQNSTIYFVNVSKFTTSLSISITPSAHVNNGTETTATGSGCPDTLTCILYRDGTAVTNPDIQTLDIGNYVYVYNTTGDQNHTVATSTQTLVVVSGSQVNDAFIIYNGVEDPNSRLFSVSTNGSIVVPKEVFINGTAVSPWLYNQTLAGDNIYVKLNNPNAYNAMVWPSTFGEGGKFLTIDSVSGQLNWTSQTTTGNLLYFFWDNSSTINSYKSMLEESSSTVAKAYFSNVLVSGQYVMNFSTSTGFPSLTYMPTGIHTIKINAFTNYTYGAPSIYGEIYKVNGSGGDELLLGTTAQTPLTTSEASYDLIISVSAVNLNSTDRMVIKTKLASSDATAKYNISLAYQGTTSASYIFPQAPPSIFSFVPYSGATKNVDLNSWNLTNIEFLKVLSAQGAVAGATPYASADEFVIEGNGHTGMSVISSSGSQGWYAFSDQNGLAGAIMYNHNGDQMVFYRGGATGMVLTSTGFLIGSTLVPNQKLVVEGTSNFTNSMIINSGGGATDSDGLNIYHSSNDGYDVLDVLSNWNDVATGGNLTKIGNAGGTKFLINNYGMIGVNTVNPTTRLNVNGNLSVSDRVWLGFTTYLPVSAQVHANGSLMVTTSNGGNALLLTTAGMTHYNGNFGINTRFGTQDITFGNTSSEIARIKGDTGNIGFGTTAPLSSLHISRENATLKIQSSSVGGGTEARICFEVSSDTRNLCYTGISTDRNTQSLNFWTLKPGSATFDWDADLTKRMTIETVSGDVGIGTATPAVKLHLSNTTYTELRIEAMGGGVGDKGVINFYSNNGRSLGKVQGVLEGSSGNNGRLEFYTNANGTINAEALRMTITPFGNINITPGNLTITQDTDSFLAVGRGKIGFVGFSDYFGFGHTDSFSTGGYALLQASDGSTFINTATGKTMSFRINNADIMTMTAGGLVVSAGSLNATNTIRQGGCPSGFTRWGLSCLETNEEGTDTVDGARITCYTKYKARLPNLYNLILAFNQSIIVNDGGTELSNNVAIEGSTLTCLYYNGGQPITTSFGSDLNCPTAADYRCEIPFAGGI